MIIPTLALRSRTDASFIEPLESRITPGAITFPSVVSLNRETPTTAGTAAGSVVYKVIFSDNVTGVDATDFKVFTTTDATANPAVTVTGSGKTYHVTVSGVQGNGDLRLDLVDDNTIGVPSGMEKISLGGFGLGDGSFTGQTYKVLQTGPKVSAIATIGATNTRSPNVSWKVTFSEAVTGVDPSDFALAVAGGLTAPNAITVTPVSATVYTVSTTGLAGAGTVGLNLVDDGTIKDANLNPLQTSPLNFGTAQTVTAGSYVSAVATGDLNGDGKADFVVTNGSSSSVSVFLGAGNGTFAAKQDYTTGGGPSSVVIADVNGDGRPDLVVAANGNSGPPSYTSTTVSVLLGNGDGTFQPKQDYGNGYSQRAVAVGDLNGDGRPDIAVTAYASGTSMVNILLGDRNGGFLPQHTFATGKDPQSVAIGDVNKDGKADVITGNAQDNTISVLLGKGDGDLLAKTDFATGTSPRSVVLADLNGDGKQDVVTANYTSGTVSVLLGTGTGSFATQKTFTTGANPSGVAVADFNGDGKLDLATASGGSNPRGIVNENQIQVVSASPQVSVLLGKGDGTFDAKQDFSNNGGYALAIGVADFDGDGKADLVTANGFSNSANTLLNTGKGNFTGPLFTVETPTPPTPTLDLAVTSVVGPGFALAGQTGDFDVHYANLGTLAATTGFLKITLPVGSTFNAGASDSRWVDNADGTIQVDNLSVGGSSGDQVIQFEVQFGPTLPNAGTLSTVATISTPSPTDTDPTNNSGTDVTPYYSGIYVTTPGVAVGKKFAPPLVKVFDRATGLEVASFLAYEATYRDSIRVAVGDLNYDGIDDIVTTTQHGTGRLRVFGALGEAVFGKGPFSQEIAVFDGKKDQGAFVAVGDVTGDGRLDIVTGEALGGGKVRVYDGLRTNDDGSAKVTEFQPFGAKFKGGVRVAVGDLDGSSIQPNALKTRVLLRDEIIVGMGYYGGQVKVYEAVDVVPTLLPSLDVTFEVRGAPLQVGGKNYRGGVSVASGDVNNDGIDDIIVGRNSGKPSIVEVFSGFDFSTIGPVINPFDLDPLHPKNTFGVRVAAVDVNQDGFADIITSVGVKNGSQVKIYDGKALAMGSVELLVDRSITAFPDYPNVALWVAGTRDRVLLK